MQLMAERGREYEVTQGLGWIPGEVDRIAPADPDAEDSRTWAGTRSTRASRTRCSTASRSGRRACTPISCIRFISTPTERADLVAEADYGGPVTAIVGRDTMVGTQFHPEKSQRLGLRADREFPEVEAVILFPAIDLKDGLCVRLEQGDMARATVFQPRSGRAGAGVRDARASSICTSSISTARSPASR